MLDVSTKSIHFKLAMLEEGGHHILSSAGRSPRSSRPHPPLQTEANSLHPPSSAASTTATLISARHLPGLQKSLELLGDSKRLGQ